MKVWPTSEVLRKYLRHPTKGAFRATGPADWPEDVYTFRRLAEQDIVKVDPELKSAKKSEA